MTRFHTRENRTGQTGTDTEDTAGDQALTGLVLLAGADDRLLEDVIADEFGELGDFLIGEGISV